MSERVGRGVGAVAGYAARGAVGVTAEPAKAAWEKRPDVPARESAWAGLGWILLLCNPIGWAVLAVSFFSQVVIGRDSISGWIEKQTYFMAKLTKRLLIAFAIVAAIVLVIVVIVAASGGNGS